jgi:hypothetical protein
MTNKWLKMDLFAVYKHPSLYLVSPPKYEAEAKRSSDIFLKGLLMKQFAVAKRRKVNLLKLPI